MIKAIFGVNQTFKFFRDFNWIFKNNILIQKNDLKSQKGSFCWGLASTKLIKFTSYVYSYIKNSLTNGIVQTRSSSDEECFKNKLIGTWFFNGPTLASFCLISSFSSPNFREKNYSFSGIWTRIVGVEGEYADQLSTTPMHLVVEYLSWILSWV